MHIHDRPRVRHRLIFDTSWTGRNAASAAAVEGDVDRAAAGASRPCASPDTPRDCWLNEAVYSQVKGLPCMRLLGGLD
jgi:hypothetical protein